MAGILKFKTFFGNIAFALSSVLLILIEEYVHDRRTGMLGQPDYKTTRSNQKVSQYAIYK